MKDRLVQGMQYKLLTVNKLACTLNRRAIIIVDHQRAMEDD